ncbi:hypothetical protein B0T10DRAFT_495092 [Thelonectria olida]|uniref:Uncharacterized protein n=1 Tax=Thelonectria olida TaxID=1576542 RepID=A0A9P8VWP7_9HYPO|nr:hypothetical protein B0T10DRAFT_495092 [Thelonectria olida]
MPGQQLHESVLHPGCILFLPRKDEIALDLEGEHGLPPPGAFNHPVVVFLKRNTESRVAILIITSFGGKPLLDKSEGFRRGYLPIHPSQPHPESGLLLRLNNGSTLDKASCVKICEYYTVPYSILRNLRNGQRCTLSSTSYKILVNQAKAFISWEHIRNDPEATALLHPGHSRARSMPTNGYRTISSITRPPTYSRPADSMRPLITTTHPRYHPSRHSRLVLEQPFWIPAPSRSGNWGYRYIVAPIWSAAKALVRLIICLGSKPVFWQCLMWLLILGACVYGIWAIFVAIIKAISDLVDFIRNAIGGSVVKVYAWFS